VSALCFVFVPMRRLHHSVIGEYVFLVSFPVQLCFNRMAQLRANYEHERPFRHFWCKSRGSLSSVCLVKPPDKFFVAVLEKDPFIRGMSSMNRIAMLCDAMKTSRAAPRLGQDVAHLLRARVFPHIVSLEAEILFGAAHIMFQVKIPLPSYFLLHSQSALPLTSVKIRLRPQLSFSRLCSQSLTSGTGCCM
jgi:hypothetical protein